MSTRVRLLDAETDEVLLVTDAARPGTPAYKGWLLRWRAHHREHTGHKIIVEVTQIKEES
jgi:hypothetical protein